MTSACRDAVHAATGRAFSDAEVDDFVNRVARRAMRTKKGAPGVSDRAALREAAESLTREDVRQALVERKARMAADLATARRASRLAAMPRSMDEAQRLDALNLGSERQGVGTSSSVSAEGDAEATRLLAPLRQGWESMPGLMARISDFWRRTDGTMELNTAIEMSRLQGAEGVEPTGDEGALHAARVAVQQIERSRQTLNDAGAYIDKLKGYIVRQVHDAERVAGGFWREVGEANRRLAAGDLKGALDVHSLVAAAQRRAFETWRGFIRPLLHADTFKDLPLEDIAAGEEGNGGWAKGLSTEDRFLYQIWTNIVSGQHETMSGGDTLADWKPPGSKAAALSRPRVLQFKDAQSWLDYNRRFGRGTLFSAVHDQLQRAGRNAALMRMYGPSPEAAWAVEKGRLGDLAQERGPEGAAVIRKLNGQRLQSGFDQLTGRAGAPEHLRIAQIMATVRNWETMSKLGSMVFSKTTDVITSGHTMARAGAGFLKGYEGVFKGITRLQDADARHAAEMLDAGMQGTMGRITGGLNNARGWTAWGAQFIYKLNGFNFLNEGVKAGEAAIYSRHLGLESEKPYDALNAGTRETFQRWGIAADDWEKARQGVYQAADGKKWFTFEHLASDPDLELKFRAMVHNVLADTVSEPRARERRATTGGYAAGTLQGEVMRAFSQFKGFTYAIAGRHLIPAARGYAGYSPVALIAHMVIMGTLAGFLSLQAKMIIRGLAPRPLTNPDGSIDKRLWAASLAQGAGLGIWGDFVLGEQNRNGQGFSLDTLAGPTVSDAEQAAGILRQTWQANAFGTDEERDTANRDTPGQLIRFAKGELPGGNLFYTRAALDYLIFWRLQEAASPGFLRRYQEHVETSQRTHFLVSPASAVGQ